MSENIKITLTPATVQQIQLKTGPTTILVNGSQGGGGNSFGIINIAGQANVAATTNTDVLRMVAGSGILITTDPPNNAVTVAVTGGSSVDQYARDNSNGAYTKANTANVTGEAAFAKANTANTTADASIVFGQAAFTKANTANITAEAAFAKANVANTTADASIVFGQAAFNKANTANVTAEAAFANANNSIKTSAQIRANLSNTAPVNYDPSTGIFSHALSGVTATGYGSAAIVPKVVVDDKGHVTSIVNTGIVIDASAVGSGILLVDRGGTGSGLTYTNGQLLIGNTISGGLDKSTLSNTGTGGLLITNGNGTITLAANVIWVRGNIGGVTPISYAAANGNFTHAGSGVTATGYGTATQIPVLVVNESGHVTSVTNTAIAGLDAGVMTTGRLAVARGGTFLSPTIVNGAIFIGNTVNSGFDFNTIANTGTGGILITNGQGTITLGANVIWMRGNISATTPIAYAPSTGVITHDTSGVGAAIYGGANTVPVVTVDTFGHITLAANSAINNLDASVVTTGNLVVARGGTGRSLGAITNGQLLIGNTTNSGFDLRTLTAGTGILITNGNGTITIDATGGSAVDQYARDKANGAVQLGYPKINVAANATLVAATTNNDTLILIQGSGILLTPNAANHSIVVSATGGAAVDQYARDKANGAVQLGYPRINVASNATLVAAVTNNDILILLAGDNMVLASNAAQSSITFNSYDQYARDKANTANVTAEAAFANANNSIKTSAQIRANISNAYPVYYNSTTGVISFVPATANGQLLIGNTVSGTFDLNTIANTGTGGILVTNDKGTITLAANVIWVRGNISATTPVSYDPSTGVVSHATSGVSATIYGGANTVPVVTVDTFGHITLAANSAVNNLDASVVTTGNLVVARGGTGRSLGAITNGQILIGNTVNSGFDLATISNTGAGGIIVSNDKGIINLTANLVWIRGNISATTPIVYTPATGVITHATSGVGAAIYGGANTVPVVTVDTFGHITLAANSAINNLDASTITTGNLVVARGGTGRSLGAITNGQILIGNTVNSGFDLATISNTGAGGIIVSNDKGIINLTANLVWIRGNISATAPIAYDATTGIITHAVSGVAATIYGGANTVPVVTIDTFGHVTLAANSAINNLDGAVITTGNLVVARGGTGRSLGAITNGQILIGNTVNSGFDLATISNTGAGGIIVSNDKGIINLTANLVWIRGNISATTPIVYTPATGVITHATSGVSATIYGGANTVPVVTVDTFGHVTLAANSAINNLDASTVTTGNLVIARGGTGRSLTGVTNGQILIGNTTNNGFDLATLTQGTNITITNGNGTITISSSAAGGNGYGIINIGGTGSANINSGSANDTLKILAGAGIILTTDAAGESLTIEATGGAAFDQFARDTANAAWLQANTANAIANSATGVSFGKIVAYSMGYGITIQ